MHGGRELVFEGTLDKDRAKAVANEEGGRAKRQVDQWAGGDGVQGEGLKQQGLKQQSLTQESLAQEVSGKTQKTWGDLDVAVGLRRGGRVAKNRDAKNRAASGAEKRPAATRLTKA
jgi:hypothetical protein